MISSSTQSAPLRINRRGVAEIVIFCLTTTALLLSLWWQFQEQWFGFYLGMAGPAERLPVLALVLKDMTITLSAAVAVFILILILVLLAVPPGWWIRIEQPAQPGVIAKPDTPLLWLGHQIEQMRAPVATPAQPNGQPAPGAQTHPQQAQFNTGTGQPVDPANPAAQPPNNQAQPGQPQPGQPQAGQNPQPGQNPQANPNPGEAGPNQPNPGAPNPDAQPGQPQQSAPATDATNEPGQKVVEQKPEEGAQGAGALGQPSQSLQDALMIEEEEEDDPLADLSDMSSLISSAFAEVDEVDPDLLALSNMLEPVDIRDLTRLSQQVAQRFAYS